MSAISSTQAGLSQFLQGLSANTDAATTAVGASNTSGGSTASVEGHHHHHHGGSGGFDKIADAVTSALQSASNGSSGSTTDPNQTITNALTQLFQNGGSGSSTVADGSSSTTGTDSAGGGSPSSFESTLKSFGVTPQEFQSDLSAALEAAKQNGSSVPAGSFVDTLG
jgi:hypothetical protein